jgi:GH15 family glucan-1,4-alpha-glucosidase
VVASDTDELENRLPAGSANLCTSSLYYGGLRSAIHLARELNEPKLAASYATQSDDLAKNIESYFGQLMHGFFCELS